MRLLQGGDRPEVRVAAEAGLALAAWKGGAELGRTIWARRGADLLVRQSRDRGADGARPYRAATAHLGADDHAVASWCRGGARAGCREGVSGKRRRVGC